MHPEAKKTAKRSQWGGGILFESRGHTKSEKGDARDPHGLNLPSHGFCDILLGTCASVLTKRFPSKLFFASSISDKFAGESRPPLDAGSGGELLLQLAQQPALGEREALQRLA